MYLPIVFLSISVNLIVCRDFYVGMFKRNDFLVAQDRLYKEKVYYSRVTAKYGRIFKCPITYLRITDRLGIGRGPTVEIIRGGLLRNFVVLRLQSVYNYPISVNIYVSCENKMARELTVTTTKDSTPGSVTGTSENATSVVTTTDSKITGENENATLVVDTTSDSTITDKIENATSTTTASPDASNNVTKKDDKIVNGGSNIKNGNETT